jgi:hypothetical protein
MAARIYRYEVPVGPVVDVTLRGPLLPGAIAARQNDRVEFWAIYDEDREPYVAKFVVMATGPEITTPPGLLGYVGTAFAMGGHLVWHLFTVVEPSSHIDARLVIGVP